MVMKRPSSTTTLLVWWFLSTTLNSLAYKRQPCTRAVKYDFQFPDECYIPPMEASLLFSEASFLMSHNAATGYMPNNPQHPVGKLVSLYSKNQVGSAYEQLNHGARALDLRPKLLSNGTIAFHHGAVDISVTLPALLEDVIQWCAENPDELVLLLHSHLSYESPNDDMIINDDSGEYKAIDLLASTYQQYDIAYHDCTAVYEATVADVMDLAALPNNRGYVVALDAHDAYASFCGKDNWVESQLVTCYPQGSVKERCTSASEHSVPMQRLKQYIMASANNEATDDANTLGPPASLYYTPLNEIQALWQVDTASAAAGMTQFSSILIDNRKSKLNAILVDFVWQGTNLDAISLLAVDNVALHGNALLSVLRTSCGQSELEECGPEIPKPRLTPVPFGRVVLCVGILALLVGGLAWLVHQQPLAYF